MSSTIASLVVELKADMTELVSASKSSREHLQNIESSAKSFESSLGGLKEAAGEVAGALGLAFTVGSVIEGIKAGVEATIAYGKELRDLSEQSRIGVVELQALTSATGDFGVDAQKTIGLVQQLSERIAGGDTSATARLGQMGLSIDALKGKAPDQLFITVATAVNAIENPMQRAAAAADLFGSKAAGAVQRLPKDLAAVVQANQDLNVAMGKDAVEAAAKWDASFDKLGTSAKAFAGNVLAPLLAKMGEYVDKASFIFNSTGNVPTPKGGGLGGDKLSIADAQAQLAAQGAGDGLTFGGKKVNTTNVDFGQGAANLLDALRKAIKPLTEDQEKFLEQLFDMGRLTKENAAAFGVTVEQMEAFRKKETDLIETQGRLAENIKAEEKAYFELGVAGGKVTDALTDKTMKHVAAIIAQRQAILEAGAAATKLLGDRSLGGAANASPFDQALSARDEGYLEIQRQKALLTENGHRGLTQDEEMAFQALAAKVEADFDDASKAIRSGGDKVGEGLGAVGAAAHAGAQQIGGALSALKDTIDGTFTADRNPTNDAAAYLHAAGEHMLSGGINFNATVGLGSLIPRAGGGPVVAGAAYRVGEQGPETFVPSGSGTIIPNGAGGGPMNVTIVVQGSVHNEKSVVDAVKRGLEKSTRLARKLPGA